MKLTNNYSVLASNSDKRYTTSLNTHSYLTILSTKVTILSYNQRRTRNENSNSVEVNKTLTSLLHT